MNLSTLTFRPATSTDLPAVSAFIWQINLAVIAPLEPAEAQKTFWEYVNPAAMTARSANHTIWIAEADSRLIGALEVRNGTHVALLFVDRAWKGYQIGRRMLETAFGVPAEWPALTVNSNPPACSAYERLGFHRVGPEKEDRGLRFQPMERPAGMALPPIN